MGSVCCCLRVEDFEDYMNPNSPVYRNCLCLGCIVQNFVNVVCPMVVIVKPCSNLSYSFIKISSVSV